MKLLVIHNEDAGDQTCDGDALRRSLSEAGHKVRYFSVEDAWQEAPIELEDVVVVVGGDGTVAEVFTALDATETTAAIVPAGSANNIATTLGIKNGLDLLSADARPRRQRFDIWEARSARGSFRFVETFGGGIFAELLAQADHVKPEPSGEAKRRLGLETIHTILERMQAQQWDIQLDGQDLACELIGVEAMNINRLGPQLVLTADADPGDGQLHLVLLHASDRSELLAYIEQQLNASGSTEPPPLEVRQAASIRLRPPDQTLLHYDDNAATIRELGPTITLSKTPRDLVVLTPDST